MSNWLDTALLDYYIFGLRLVGRKHLTQEQIWSRWLDS